MLHDILPQVVADFIRVPLGGVQQPLHALRIPLAYGLGELPTVLALDPTWQPEEVAAGALPGLRAAEAVTDSSMQFSERLRPFADGRRPDDPVLRDHASLPSSLHRKGSPGTS